jgi:hypothetical protein
MNQDHSNMAGKDLASLLDTYGADTSRWPRHAQARAGALLASDAQAGRLLAEAKALDTLLGHAPVTEQERRVALADRIVAQAVGVVPQGEARKVRPSGIVIPWPGASRDRAAPVWQSSRRPAWSAAALLAASLCFGVFVGTQDITSGAVGSLMEAVVSDSDFDQTAATIGSDGLSVALDEEFL